MVVEDPLQKEMTTHSSTLAWTILWTKEPGRLQSMGLQRVGHNGATSSNFTSLQTFHDFSTAPRIKSKILKRKKKKKPINSGFLLTPLAIFHASLNPDVPATRTFPEFFTGAELQSHSRS